MALYHLLLHIYIYIYIYILVESNFTFMNILFNNQVEPEHIMNSHDVIYSLTCFTSIVISISYMFHSVLFYSVSVYIYMGVGMIFVQPFLHNFHTTQMYWWDSCMWVLSCMSFTNLSLLCESYAIRL
jgi:hypothetical protein